MAMTKAEKEKILNQATNFFTEKIALPHKANIEKLADPEEFVINPFLQSYLAKLLCGNTSPRSMAMSLIYPRVLGTSITTTCGTQMQYFCTEVLQGYGSRIAGLDIEFVDAVDGRRKYCQLKLGPSTLNADDVEPLVAKFRKIVTLGRTNRSEPLAFNDLIVAVAYGTRNDLSQNYKTLTNKHGIPVLVGYDFWYRLTGDKKFYDELILAFGKAVEKADTEGIINKAIERLAARLS
jgi:hypothetical protein